MILRHLIGPDKMDGFYVDVGAYEPLRFSNTYFFYLNGWRGINLEARPGSSREFDKLRPRDINLELGISSKPGEMPFYVIDEDSPMNSFSREFLERMGMMKEVKREISVPVLPLVEVLERYLPNDQVIDFLTVDVEGHDLTVLKSNDWTRFRPRFIVVEDEQIEAEKSDIVHFLAQCDYKLCAQNVMILNKLNEYFFYDQSS